MKNDKKKPAVSNDQLRSVKIKAEVIKWAEADATTFCPICHTIWAGLVDNCENCEEVKCKCDNKDIYQIEVRQFLDWEDFGEAIDLAIQKTRADTLDSVGEVLKRYYNHLWNTTFFQDRWKELSSLSDKDGEG